MSFSFNNTIYRQVGTDANLSGLAAANMAAFTTMTVTGGSGSVTSITVNGVQILGATVPYTTSAANTAALVVAQINSNVSTPRYFAFREGNAGAVVTIQAATGGSRFSPCLD